jgi:hypothetical protein
VASLAPWVGQGLVLLDDERGSALHCHPEGLVGNVAIQDLTPACVVVWEMLQYKT